MAYNPDYRRKHYLKNRDKAKTNARTWRLANPEKVKNQKRMWRSRLTPNELAIVKKDASIRAVIHSAKRRRIVQSLKEVPCADCSASYPSYVMDFDHKDGNKSFTISQATARKGIDALLKEIAKCDVVCANCHRERTHRRQLLRSK